MGGGNAQKSATKRARNAEKAAKANKGSQLKVNASAMTNKCSVCMTQFMCTAAKRMLQEHVDGKHPKKTFEECFPDFTEA
ncbi:unnamed protein product [Pedinophyceae sp. YPF-701]|nr:unnamed protein product [Pedinophyceae sp. YPF-701]